MDRSFQADLDAAIEEVTALSAPNIAPVVDQCYDLRQTIIRHQRCSFWAATTAYNAGDLVMPVIPNGHRYVVKEGGISGTTEPEWLTSKWSAVSDEVLTYKEDGPDFANIFDIEWSIHDVWCHKAGQASAQVNATLAGGASAGTFTVFCSQLYDHCEAQAKKYAPVRF